MTSLSELIRKKSHFMPKSRGRQKKQKNKKSIRKPKPYEVVKQNFVRVNNPFSEDIPFEERIKIIQKIGSDASNEYVNEYENLRTYLRTYDSLYLCSFAAYYFIGHEAGIDEEAVTGGLEFPPFFLEILQCFSLYEKRTISGKQLNFEVDNFKTTVQKLNRSQALRYFDLAEKVKTQEDVGSIMLRTEMMGHTLAVRNWAYVHQMEKIAYDLAEQIQHDFHEINEFNPKDLLDILFGVVKIAEEKLNIHHRKVLEFVKCKTYQEIFDAYERVFPMVQITDFEKRNELWIRLGKSNQKIKATLMAHSDYFLKDIFTYSLEEIQIICPEISLEKIKRIMELLSLKFEELKFHNKDFIFLDNPIHSRPFINLENGTYFSAVVHIFSHIGVEILERFISNNKKLKNSYSKRKGEYLENRAESLFKESFTNAQIFCGSKWKCPESEKVFENDLTVIIEDFALIIECKSGGVTPPAKRGAPDRLFETLRELIVEPSEQAIRFENFLKENRKIHSFKNKSGKANIIDSSKIKYFVPIGLTLSNLGSIGCNLKKLIDAKIITHNLNQLAPSISLTDLETIFEILSLPAEKVHYLCRRREFEAHVKFQGDEMDLFGFYLDNGFNIGEDEYNDSMIFNLTLKSKDIDPYILGTKRGVKVKKPILQKSDYWNDILLYINGRTQEWLSSSFIMLNTQREDQIKFEKNLVKIKKMVFDGKVSKPHNWMEMVCGPDRRKYILIGYPYKDIDKSTRDGVINDIIRSHEKDDIRGVLIFGYNLNNENYPYSILAGSLKNDFFDNLEIPK